MKANDNKNDNNGNDNINNNNTNNNNNNNNKMMMMMMMMMMTIIVIIITVMSGRIMVDTGLWYLKKLPRMQSREKITKCIGRKYNKIKASYWT